MREAQASQSRVIIPRILLHQGRHEDVAAAAAPQDGTALWSFRLPNPGSSAPLLPSFIRHSDPHSIRPSNTGLWTTGGATGRMALARPFSLAAAFGIPMPSADPGPCSSRHDAAERSGSGGDRGRGMAVHVACLTRKGFAPGYKEDNQDSLFAYESFAGPSSCFFGVFDGHGAQGHKVSGFIRNQLPPALFGHVRAGLPPDEALSAAFASVNDRMETSEARRGRGCGGCGGGDCRRGCAPACGFDAYNSGSTAVVGYVDEAGVLTTAWAGDSRAVLGVPVPAAVSSSHTSAVAAGSASRSYLLASRLTPIRTSVDEAEPTQRAGVSNALPSSSNSSSSSYLVGSFKGERISDGCQCSWKAVELSSDHKPERPDERRRVMLSGGRVSRSVSSSTGNSSGPYRVWLRDQDYPGLAMSRAMGDLAARPAGIICTPETTRVMLTEAMGGSIIHGASGTGTAVGSSGSSAAARGCFLVLASDGVWDFMSSSEVVDMVGSKLSLGQGKQRDISTQSSSLRGMGLPLPPAAPLSPASTALYWNGPDGNAPSGEETGSAAAATGPGSAVGARAHQAVTYAGLRAPVSFPKMAVAGEAARGRAAAGMIEGGAGREGIQMSLVAACEAVAKESVTRWIAEYGGQYIDDITVVIAHFEPADSGGPTPSY